MGSDIKDNTVFLEFYGLPGCGKSTISHLVAEELRKQGNKVIEPTYVSDHLYSVNKRKYVKLLKLVSYFVIRPKNYIKLMQLVKSNGYRGSEVISHAANIVPKLWEYEKTNGDYVIFDEGLTQSAISLCRGSQNITENEAELYALCRNRPIRKFYINVDRETALERMKSRSKHDSRIEKINDEEEKQKALQRLEILCNAIEEYSMVSDLTGDTDSAVKIIIDYLEDREQY